MVYTLRFSDTEIKSTNTTDSRANKSTKIPVKIKGKTCYYRIQKTSKRITHTHTRAHTCKQEKLTKIVKKYIVQIYNT